MAKPKKDIKKIIIPLIAKIIIAIVIVLGVKNYQYNQAPSPSELNNEPAEEIVVETEHRQICHSETQIFMCYSVNNSSVNNSQ